jgi:hypothetical protein
MPPSLELPQPADMVATHQAGHGVVMPSNHPHHQPIEEGMSPRMTSRDYLAAEGDPVRVVRAANHKSKDGDIPKEFWQTSVNLQWHDIRHQHSRHSRNSEVAHKEMKRQELSSEVFGKERMLEPSTQAPRQELLAETAHIMEKDSHFDVRHQPHMGGVRGGYPAADRPKDKFHGNLWHSPLNTLGTISQRPEVAAPLEDEDPNTLGRRRQEKNFSDIFGVQMGERGQVTQRTEITASRTCSFLDARSEIASRNQNRWKQDEEPHRRRKEMEATSNLFDRDTPGKRDIEPDDKKVHHYERSCWDTRDILQSGSEIARRVRTRDHHHEDAGDRATAFDRKQDDLHSGQIRMGMGISPETVRQTSPPRSSPRGVTAPSSQRGKTERMNVTARDMKIAALQSSIFADAS